MPARIRKLIGGVGVLMFLIAYAVLMTVIADHLPNQWAVKLIFFVVAGVGLGRTPDSAHHLDEPREIGGSKMMVGAAGFEPTTP